MSPGDPLEPLRPGPTEYLDFVAPSLARALSSLEPPPEDAEPAAVERSRPEGVAGESR